MDNIKKNQVILSIFSIIVTIIIIIFGCLIGIHLFRNVNKLYITDNFIVDLNSYKINKVEVLKDNNINNIKNTSVKITNNKDNSHYKIIMKNIVNDEEDIKILINNSLYRNLSNLDKKDNYYVLYEGDLDSQYTAIFNIKIWSTKENNYKFNISVIEE